MRKLFISVLAIASIALLSCKKESVDTGKFKPASINIMLETKVGHESIEKNKEYKSEKDTFSITELKYFLSNITFINTSEKSSKKIDGSYILYNLENGGTKNVSFEIDETFTFDKLEISFGVDSIANNDFYNTSGDLQPGGQDGMAWSWSTGYKFIKFEGKTKTGPFIKHIGTNTNYNTIQLPASGTIEEDGNYTLHIQADILALLNGHHKVDLDQNSGHGHGHSNKHPIAKNSSMNFLKIHHFSGGEFTIHSDTHNHQHSDTHH